MSGRGNKNNPNPNEAKGASENPDAPDAAMRVPGGASTIGGGEAPPPAEEQSNMPNPDAPDDARVADPDDGLVEVHVIKDFTLNLGANTTIQFRADGTNCGKPGYYRLDPQHAKHWYVRAHSADAPAEHAPSVGSPEHVEQVTQRRTRRTIAQIAQEAAAREAAAQIRTGEWPDGE